MLLSMTGYGRVSETFDDKTITIEVRSLNSKFTDIRLKIPQNYKEKETELRKLLMDKLQRGKIELTIDIKSLQGDDEFSLNLPLFKKYYQELTALATELSIQKGDMMQSVLRLPNVVATAASEIDEDEWALVLQILKRSIDLFDKHRREEGSAMENDLRLRIENISNILNDVNGSDHERIGNLRQRLHQKLEEHMGKDKVDENRFEQEILYYLEKFDINEEKVRLAQHCKYFMEVLEGKGIIKGKKLSFISQEIGREINTLGAKAYSSEVQRNVVEMKDELEKIKEQVANSV